MTIERATDRSLYAMTGADVLPFLQGMVSNDVMGLAKAPGIVWAALLTPQGKYLADFLVVNTDGKLLFDIKSSIAEATIRRLSLYRLRADVNFTLIDLPIWRGLGIPPGKAVADPRHPALGWRLYGEPSATDQISAQTIDWDAIRVTHCIPETGVELIPDESYLLECGFERLHGVDFRKGCYVGQEVTARMKHKTELRKGLVRMAIKGAAPVGATILQGDKEAGKLFTQSGGFAICHLRFDRMTDLKADEATLQAI